MKWILIAAIIFVGMQTVYAGIDEDIDNLRVSKLQAEAGVRAIKGHFTPDQKQYQIGKEKYLAVLSAYNSYGDALLNNYVLGSKAKLDKTAELASSREKDYKEYVQSLRIQLGGPAIFVTVGVLIDIAAQVYSYIDKYSRDGREEYAKAKKKEITWLDWDKIN
jgi:hypothetical protein